jgi:periplasmic divalent cation tolerance protein
VKAQRQRFYFFPSFQTCEHETLSIRLGAAQALMTDHIQVMTTTETREDAQGIARELVARGLAGCVQIVGPITSTFQWQGEIETAQEWLCLAKGQQGLYQEIEAAIRELHPYDVPEILALPVVAGGADYLA